MVVQIAALYKSVQCIWWNDPCEQNWAYVYIIIYYQIKTHWPLSSYGQPPGIAQGEESKQARRFAKNLRSNCSHIPVAFWFGNIYILYYIIHKISFNIYTYHIHIYSILHNNISILRLTILNGNMNLTAKYCSSKLSCCFGFALCLRLWLRTILSDQSAWVLICLVGITQLACRFVQGFSLAHRRFQCHLSIPEVLGFSLHLGHESVCHIGSP